VRASHLSAISESSLNSRSRDDMMSFLVKADFTLVSWRTRCLSSSIPACRKVIVVRPSYLYSPVARSSKSIPGHLSRDFCFKSTTFPLSLPHSRTLRRNLWYHQISYDRPGLPFAPRLKAPSHSSHARPAPNPRPTHAGHALRLKRRTEKTTPKDNPSEDLIRREERQWSHW
jgi:hypothetical protein